MFERILVAVDGTPASFAAALFGAEVAAPRAALHLLCVADRANPPLGAPDETSLTARCSSVLGSAHAVVMGRAPIASREVASGRALPAILQREDEVDADLVCLGSGRSRLRPGHVSAAVARESHASVAIVREGATVMPRLSRIAVGLRRGPTAMEAARRALKIAVGTGAEVHLHSVVPVGAEKAEAQEREILPLIEELGKEAETMGISRPHARIVPGDPAAALLDAVDELRADLLLVGAGARRPLRPLGRVVTRLTSSCPCPLLICRPPT